jgi:hypothetical protein
MSWVKSKNTGQTNWREDSPDDKIYRYTAKVTGAKKGLLCSEETIIARGSDLNTALGSGIIENYSCTELKDIELLKKSVKTFSGDKKLQAELVKLEKDLSAPFTDPQVEEALQDQERIKAQFVFDPDKVLKQAVFSFCKLKSDKVAFGLLMPKNVEILDKKGAVVGQKQALKPILITSAQEIFDVTEAYQNKEGINFESIPSRQALRWSLPSIKAFIDGKSPKVDGRTLFAKVKKQYEHYVYYREQAWYDVHALWDIGTYFHQLFSAYPLFEMRGLTGTGKTKTMDISRRMSLNATPVMVNPSESTLFRETQDLRPTKYIDEAEKLFRFQKGRLEADSRAELINASFTSSGAVPRQEKVGDHFKTIYYSAYSPTMIGSINGLFGATENRAIIHTAIKAQNEDARGELEPNDDEDVPIWQEIRDDLHIYALQSWQLVEEAYKQFKGKETGLKKRDLQIWRPVLCIASLIDSEAYERALLLAKKLTSIKQSDAISEGSQDYKIVEATYQLLQTGQSVLYVEAIKERLFLLYPDDKAKQNPISNKTISNRLDKIGFREMRGHNYKGSFFEFTLETFQAIITPICPDFFSSESSDSSDSNINNKNKSDESQTNLTNLKEQEKPKPDESDEIDESDDDIRVGLSGKPQEEEVVD